MKTSIHSKNLHYIKMNDKFEAMGTLTKAISFSLYELYGKGIIRLHYSWRNSDLEISLSEGLQHQVRFVDAGYLKDEFLKTDHYRWYFDMDNDNYSKIYFKNPTDLFYARMKIDAI